MQCFCVDYAFIGNYVKGVSVWCPLAKLDVWPVVYSEDFFGKGLEYCDEVCHLVYLRFKTGGINWGIMASNLVVEVFVMGYETCGLRYVV